MVVVVALVAGAAIGFGIASRDGDDVATDTTVPPTTEPEAFPLTAEQIAVEFGDAVYRVTSLGCDEIWTGTAFAIDEHHLVTNHHVVANSTEPRLTSRDGDQITGTVIGWSERPDLAVIRVAEQLGDSLEWAPTEELREGQSLVALGYPVPATDFTVTPGSILSFQGRSGTREAVRTNALLDRGNSGGPALDDTGRVIGVVTEMAPNFDGLQLVPLVFTHAVLGELIDGFIAEPEEPTVDCSGGFDWAEPPADTPESWFDEDIEAYGDDSRLDRLWDRCEDGDLEACDDLWWLSPIGSEYEAFGDTCGERRRPGGGWCSGSGPAE